MEKETQSGSGEHESVPRREEGCVDSGLLACVLGLSRPALDLRVAWERCCLALPLEQKSVPGKGDKVKFTRTIYDTEKSRDDF